MKKIISIIVIALATMSLSLANNPLKPLDAGTNGNKSENVEIRTVSNNIFINVYTQNEDKNGFFTFECSSDKENFDIITTKYFEENDNNILFSFFSKLPDDNMTYRVYKFSCETVSLIAEYEYKNETMQASK